MMLAKLLLISLIPFCSIIQAIAKPKERPNFLIILVDDMGWSDLGSYGSEISTPVLDRLATEGMRFTQMHNTAKCFPSRAALITGVYAQDSGYHTTYRYPLRNAVTFGEVLQSAGYITLWSGKHHGVDNPYDRGFTHYSGLRHGASNHFNPGRQREGEPAPARKHTLRPWIFDDEIIEPYTPEDRKFHTTDTFTDYALQWLEDYKDDDAPILLYMAYTAPHDPLMAWPEDIAKYEGVYDVGYETIRKQRYEKQKAIGLIDESFPLSEPVYQNWDALSPEERSTEIRRMQVYAAMIDHLDRNIGRLLDKLKETGRHENTLILFMSDNGASAEVVGSRSLATNDPTAEIGGLARWESQRIHWANVSNTPMRHHKNNSHQGGINTPFIAYWPGKIHPGQINHDAMHFIDIMPTLIELTGAKYPKTHNGEDIAPMRGISLVDALKGKPLDRQEPLFWNWQKGMAIRDDHWKLVTLDSTEWELFDMQKDRSETRNLAKEHPDIVADLKSQLLNWVAQYE